MSDHNLRFIAARVIDQILDGQSLADCLEPAVSSLSARDRAFVQAICYGVCRFYSRLDAVLGYLLTKPMKAKDSDVYAVLLVGLYQLMDMRVPPHAAVAETVNAAIKLKKPWARSFVNAILREYLRQQETLSGEIKNDEEAFYAHPYWWIKAIKSAWPTHWQTILEANNQHPPMALRVNQQHVTREAYLQKVNANIIPETQHGIILDEASSVDELPGFAAGDVFVQDGAAQLAAELLDVQSGMRVLDACAAPGGKLTHLLEIAPTAQVVALEKDESRMQVIQDNLQRLKLNATCICQDVANVNAWWDGQLFDRILLDAPCSASGVVRRHPDIKLLRQQTDIPAFVKEQLRLLTALWPLLKKDGLFLYATCSIFPEENVQVVKAFLEAQTDAEEKTLEVFWGLPCEFGRQILPGMHNMDGFYYACLRKR